MYMWDMTHSFVWHGLYICVIWLIHIFYMHYSLWCMLFWSQSSIYVTWLYIRDMIHICDMTKSFVWHDSYICVICLSRGGISSFSCKGLFTWHHLFTYVAWLMHISDITHTYVDMPFLRWYILLYSQSAIYVTWLYIRNMHTWHDSSICVTRPIHIWYMSVSCHIYEHIISAFIYEKWYQMTCYVYEKWYHFSCMNDLHTHMTSCHVFEK